MQQYVYFNILYTINDEPSAFQLKAEESRCHFSDDDVCLDILCPSDPRVEFFRKELQKLNGSACQIKWCLATPNKLTPEEFLKLMADVAVDNAKPTREQG